MRRSLVATLLAAPLLLVPPVLASHTAAPSDKDLLLMNASQLHAAEQRVTKGDEALLKEFAHGHRYSEVHGPMDLVA